MCVYNVLFAQNFVTLDPLCACSLTMEVPVPWPWKVRFSSQAGDFHGLSSYSVALTLTPKIIQTWHLYAILASISPILWGTPGTHPMLPLYLWHVDHIPAQRNHTLSNQDLALSVRIRLESEGLVRRSERRGNEWDNTSAAKKGQSQCITKPPQTV